MTIKTTTHLTLARAASWLDRIQIPPALIVAVIILIVAAGISAFNRRAAQQVVAVPTPALPAPIIIIASPLPQGVPPTAIPQVQQVSAQLPNALRRAVVAYSQPDAGTAIGAIEQGRTYAILARWGSEWLQADVSGSGVVWLRADQVLDLPADLADLKPTDAPIVVNRPIVVYEPVYVPAAAPPELAVSTPEPEQYQVTNAPSPCSTERECNLRNRLANEHVQP